MNLGAKSCCLLFISGTSDVTEICLENIVEAIPFNNSNRCSEVSYVAPLSEDIDLK